MPRGPLRPSPAIAAPWTAIALAIAGGCSAPPVWQGQVPLRLQDYHANFARDAGTRYDAAATIDDFVAMAGAGRVLWLGDHHRHAAVHERQLELLHRLQRAGIRLAIGLEAIGTEDEPMVEAYLRGRGDVRELAAAIHRRSPATWLCQTEVDRDHYRAVLAFARASRSPVFGIEPVPRLPLSQRDATIAENVRAAAHRHPDRLVVVVVGQAHLLGDGRLAQRTGLKGLAVGAVPPPTLQHATGPKNGDLWRSDGGLWFFAAR